MILVGTGGWTYLDWVGALYPAGTREDQMLSIYARKFGATEVAAEMLRSPEEAEALARQVPEGFRFAVRVPQSVTQERAVADLRPLLSSMQPLIDAGRFACLLASFPAPFDDRPQNRDFLLRIGGLVDGRPLAVELRHKSWIGEGTERWLRERSLCYCAVDLPRLPGLTQPVVWVTGPVAYVRFHGRNLRGWQLHADRPEALDYAYDVLELAEWLPKLEDMAACAPVTLAIMNNIPRAQAVESARLLQQLLQVQEEG